MVMFNVKLIRWFFSLKDRNECEKLGLCLNNGTCHNNEGSYICLCSDGWKGQHCDRGDLWYID